MIAGVAGLLLLDQVRAMTAVPLPSRPEPERETPGLLVSPWEDSLPADDADGFVGWSHTWSNVEQQRANAAKLAERVADGIAAGPADPTPRADVPAPDPAERVMSAADRAAIVAGTAGTLRPTDDE